MALFLKIRNASISQCECMFFFVCLVWFFNVLETVDLKMLENEEGRLNIIIFVGVFFQFLLTYLSVELTFVHIAVSTVFMVSVVYC